MAHRVTCGEEKKMVKHRKVLKYYETDCRYNIGKSTGIAYS